MDLSFDRQGLLTCASYASPPNSFAYCGPDKQVNLRAYLQTGQADQGLAEIIQDFATLYPYLRLIASENKIPDPFDIRVVKAYWLGNQLLNQVKVRSFAKHISEDLGLKKKAKIGQLNPLMAKLEYGVPHHNFHVLNVFIRTGHQAIKHTLKTMDECRIGWGIIKSKVKSEKLKVPVKSKKLNINYITVLTKPLVYNNGQLMLGRPEDKTLNAEFGEYKIGDLVSFHWGQVCERISLIEAKRLEYYTQQAIRSANSEVGKFL